MAAPPAAVAAPAPSAPRSLRRGVLIAAAVLYVTGTFGSWIGPAWVDERPVVVLALNSRNRNLFGSVPYIDAVPYALLGFSRLFVVAVVLYFVGAWFGTRALAWTESKIGELPAVYRWFQTGIDRAGWAFVVVMPGSNLVCMMVGHRRMPVRVFLPLVAIGIALKLVVLRVLGNAFEDEIRTSLDFIDKYQWWVFGALMALSFMQSGRKVRNSPLPAPPDKPPTD